MQSLGRSLRLHESKDHAKLFDIVDSFGGYFDKHYDERKKLYDRERLEYKEREVSISDFCKKNNIDFF